ncbi:hypothetical protein OAM67_00810 [bacterium]|nr:hypothetical protein [bacterium]
MASSFHSHPSQNHSLSGGNAGNVGNATPSIATQSVADLTPSQILRKFQVLGGGRNRNAGGSAMPTVPEETHSQSKALTPESIPVGGVAGSVGGSWFSGRTPKFWLFVAGCVAFALFLGYQIFIRFIKPRFASSATVEQPKNRRKRRHSTLEDKKSGMTGSEHQQHQKDQQHQQHQQQHPVEPAQSDDPEYFTLLEELDA